MSSMRRSKRWVGLSRVQYDYLIQATYLPFHLRQIVHSAEKGPGGVRLHLEPTVAEEFRTAFTDRLAEAGFDADYEPTEEGTLLEDLIDAFYRSSRARPGERGSRPTSHSDEPDPHPLHEALERFGREAGLERKSSAWYRHTDEAIAVSDLQRSQYGPQYYFNQGFWLRELGDERYPKGQNCHISLRLESLLAEQRERIGELLDLDHEMPQEDRVAQLVALFNEQMRPVIERGGTLAGLKAMVEDGTLATAAIRGSAQQVLAQQTLDGN